MIEAPSAKSTEFTFLTQCYLTVILVLLDILNLLYTFKREKKSHKSLYKNCIYFSNGFETLRVVFFKTSIFVNQVLLALGSSIEHHITVDPIRCKVKFVIHEKWSVIHLYPIEQYTITLCDWNGVRTVLHMETNISNSCGWNPVYENGRIPLSGTSGCMCKSFWRGQLMTRNECSQPILDSNVLATSVLSSRFG
jgi:hypothetical protein